MITGGVAAVIYRDPRLTRDVDLVLQLHRDRIATLLSAFDADAFYLPRGGVAGRGGRASRGRRFGLGGGDFRARS